MPGGSGALSAGLRPDNKRNREFLEQFSLDTLKMVGTLNLGGSHYGLVQTKDGRVHRVVVGEHIGTNDGKITDITPSKIALVEIIPDGLGGYIERPAALGAERVIGRETHRMKRSILQTLRGRISWLALAWRRRHARRPERARRRSGASRRGRPTPADPSTCRSSAAISCS